MGKILQTFPGDEEEKKTNPAQQMTSFPAMRILLIAGWFGLLTGLLEAIYLVGWQQFIRKHRINLSQHVLWMAPVTELFIFILLGCILALLVWRFPRLFTLRVTCFILALLSFLALLLIVPQLNIYAKYLLAIGLSVQTARIIGKHSQGFYRLVRITSVGLAAMVFGLVLFTFIRDAVVEQRAIAKLPPASSSAPNVILITLDTVRAKSLSLYGYERQTTPQLEKLAKDGAVFEQAIATASWTLPSHASILTGRYPHELSVSWTKPLKTSHETLAEELSHRGYESAGFVANYLFCSREVGLARGMLHYEDYPVSVGQMILSSSLGRAISSAGFIRRAVGYDNNLNSKNAEALNDDFLKWVSSRNADRPYFAFLNYFDAHEPLLPPAPFDGQFGPTKPDGTYQYQSIGVGFTDKHSWQEADAEKYRNAYDSSITYLDHQLGELFAKLSEQGQLDNTVVIITADHGELLGEHGLFGHGNSLNIETLHVPLLIRFPSRVPKGMRVQQLVSLRDLPATILDLIGEESQSSIPGESLGRYFGETTGEPDSGKQQMIFSELEKASWIKPWYPASKYSLKSLVTEQYHYVRNGDGSEELYDRKDDPEELQNLAQAQKAQEVLEEFKLAMKDAAFSK